MANMVYIDRQLEYNKEFTNKYKKGQLFISLAQEGLKWEKSEYTYYQTTSNRMMRMNGIEYMKEILKNHDSIVMNQNVVGGMPSIKGTRMPVSLIIACLRDGMSIEDICKDYNLSSQEIASAMEYVIDILDTPFVYEGDR